MKRPGQLSPGDLAMVIYLSKRLTCRCKNGPGWMGRPFVVKAIRQSTNLHCGGCGFMSKEQTTVAEVSGVHLVFEVDRLKRIPPLEELEGEKQKEDLREPA